MANSYMDMRVPVSADEVASHCVDDPEFALNMLADLASRGIDCIEVADDGYIGSMDQQQIPEFLERLARAIRLVHSMTATGNAE